MPKLTAIVTGASEGLGKSLALELAKRNIDLVLVSLPGSGLENLSIYIRRNFEVKVKCFAADLTDTNTFPELFQSLKEEGITAQILINNAGIGNWAWFDEKDISFYKKQIELNVITPVLLTRLFLDHRDNSLESYVLNVGSLGGQFVLPCKQVYGATKSFISYFTRCLQLELCSSNTKVSLLSPGGINTKPELLVMNHNLQGIARATILEAEHVAKAAIAGLLTGKKEIIPGLINRVLVFLDSILPNRVKTFIIRRKLKTVLKRC